MRISKDMYEYILRFADDETTLNMFAVNKKFNDAKFIVTICKRKYPYVNYFGKYMRHPLEMLLHFKEDVKKYYVNTIKYIIKLEKFWEMPYITSPAYCPQNFHLYYRNQPPVIKWTEALFNAVTTTNIQLIKNFIDKGAKIDENIIWNAVRHENLNVVKYLIENGGREYDKALIGGIRNINILKLLVENGKENINYSSLESTFKYSAFEGDLEAVKYLLSKRSFNFKKAMKYAAAGGKIEILKFLISKGGNYFNKSMKAAVTDDQFETVKFLVEQGANNFNESMIACTTNGSTDIFQFLVEKGGRNFQEAARACKNDEVMKQFILSEERKYALSLCVP
jgi:hypothetical protein